MPKAKTWFTRKVKRAVFNAMCHDDVPEFTKEVRNADYYVTRAIEELSADKVNTRWVGNKYSPRGIANALRYLFLASCCKVAQVEDGKKARVDSK